MPLLDHFHPPLLGVHSWESFLARWVCGIGETLNVDLLPKGYFAEVKILPGRRIEVGANDPEHSKPWVPPSADFTFPAIFPDFYEVLVFNAESGRTLVGVVELISPGNKDRPEARRAFAARCSSYLQEGIGLVVVDIVTRRLANLHDELIDLLELGERFKMAGDSPVYATAYRPVRGKGGEDSVETWLARLGWARRCRLCLWPSGSGLACPSNWKRATPKSVDVPDSP